MKDIRALVKEEQELLKKLEGFLPWLEAHSKNKTETAVDFVWHYTTLEEYSTSIYYGLVKSFEEEVLKPIMEQKMVEHIENMQKRLEVIQKDIFELENK